MTKLHQLLGYDAPKPGDFGIEIEIEGKHLVEVNSGGWLSVKDGSLRGESFEYVFDHPVDRVKVPKMLDFLVNKLKNSELNFSFRTSVHVHMNMLDCTHNDLLNTIYTYLLLEEPFLFYCGKERKGNRFCLRLQDAEGIMDTLQFLFKNEFKDLAGINRDSVRYASINLEALNKYGSLEFRAMRGNLDKEVIDTWVEALYRVRTFAKGIADPIEIYNLYIQNSPTDFLKLVLGDISDKFLYPRAVKDMNKSFSLSIDLPHAFRNKTIAKKKSKKSVDTVGMADVIGRGIDAPIAMLNLFDVNNNVFRLGDQVKVVDSVDGIHYNWVEEMDEFVGDGETYEVIGIDGEREGIELAGVEFYFPHKSIEILRRKQF